MSNYSRKKQKNKLFLKMLKKNLRFCPYCREIFTSTKSYKVTDSKKYTCTSCGKTEITHEDYKTQVKNGKNYKINGEFDKRKTNEFIYKEAEQLMLLGFSIQDIHKITHFSRTRITEVIKNKNKIQKKEDNCLSRYSKETFFKLLKLDSELTEKVISKQFLTKDDVNIIITEALKYGCNFSFIAKLLQISRRKISPCSQKLTNEELIKIKSRKELCKIKYEDNPSLVGYNIIIIESKTNQTN